MCGIVGIVSTSNVNQLLYDALTVLQHRGQDAAGIVTFQDNRFFLRKDNGLVRDVFHTRHMRRLVGNVGIGHVRYPTAGSSSSAEAQPFYVNSPPYGITLAHNGNLTNADELSSDLFRTDLRHINTNSDSEVLLNVFAHELQKLGKLNPPTKDEIFSAVRAVHKRCKGAYAVIAMITGYGIVGFRDPNGIRPACYGVRENEEGQKEYMIASESVASMLPVSASFVTLLRARLSILKPMAPCIQNSAPNHPSSIRVFSSMSILPVPTRSWTAFPVTRPGSGWARCWQTRSCASGPTMISTW